MNSRGLAVPGHLSAPVRLRPFARRAAPLAAIVIASLALGTHAQRTPSGSGLVAEAARLLDPASVLPARLSIGTPEPSCFVRLPPVESSVRAECKGHLQDQTSDRRLSRLSRRAKAAVAGPSTTEALHALALMDMAWGDSGGKSLTRAISSLQQASRLTSRKAPVLTDLAAAHLLRAERLARPRDLMDALEAATEAVRLDSASAAARFNLALALDRNGMDARATAAWKAYLSLDSVSGWAREARARVRALAPRPAPAPPATGEDTAAVARFAAQHPQEALLLGWDRVLGEWGAAVLEGHSARAGERLELAERLGGALAANGKDATLVDQIRVIRTASRNPQALRRLAGALREYATARAAYRESRHDAARDGLARVRAAAHPGSPLHQWATVFYGGAEAYRDPRRGEPIVRRAALAADSLRHPALAGRARWLLATSLLRQTRYREARDEYAAAARRFRRAGEREHLGAVQVYGGTAEHHLDNNAGAYASFHEALMTLRPYRGSRWLHSAMWALADAAAGDGYLHATQHVLDEDVEVTRLAGNAIDAAEALTTRARLLVATGLAERAVAELDAGLATDALKRVEAAPARAWLQTELWEARAAAAATRGNTVRAHRLLDSAVKHWTAQNNVLRLLPPLVARADASLSLGDTAAARRDLDRVLAVLASKRDSLFTSPERVLLLQALRGVAGRLALRQIAAGRVQQALLHWEQAHAALLPAAIAPPRRPGERLRARRGETAVVHAVVGDTLLIWTVRDTTVAVMRRTVDREALLRDVEHARVRLEQGPRAAGGRPSAELERLYDLLVRPVETRLGPPESPLLFVSDPLLEGIPFAALRDRRRGRYLVQDHPLRVLPTLREPRRTPPPAPAAAAPALLVAATGFDRRAYPELELLPSATDEVRALARGYPAATELAGASATRDAVLARVPRARVIHFAGHALFDDQNPGRSRLLLSVDRTAEGPAEVTAVDVERLRLRPGALVVLSACQTLRAPAGRFGGFAGLAGAFLTAGGGGVVGSLWSVDDEQTRILMTAFHQAYRERPDGAAALRTAQLQMLGGPDDRTRFPGAWAGFRYTGY